MNSGLASFAKLVMGSLAGAAIGASIGLLFAPRSGEEMQAETQAFINRMQTEGNIARDQAEEQMMNRFRQQVNDPQAFTSSN